MPIIFQAYNYHVTCSTALHFTLSGALWTFIPWRFDRFQIPEDCQPNFSTQLFYIIRQFNQQLDERDFSKVFYAFYTILVDKNSDTASILTQPIPSFLPSPILTYCANLPISLGDKEPHWGDDWSRGLDWRSHSSGFPEFSSAVSLMSEDLCTVPVSFITTLIISDRGDWCDTRDKWPMDRNQVRSWWHRHTSLNIFFWPQPMVPWTTGFYIIRLRSMDFFQDVNILSASSPGGTSSFGRIINSFRLKLQLFSFKIFAHEEFSVICLFCLKLPFAYFSTTTIININAKV